MVHLNKDNSILFVRISSQNKRINNKILRNAIRDVKKWENRDLELMYKEAMIDLRNSDYETD